MLLYECLKIAVLYHINTNPISPSHCTTNFLLRLVKTCDQKAREKSRLPVRQQRWLR